MYHPNISVEIKIVQINATSVNVSVDVTPELEDISAYLLEVYYESTKTDEIPELIVNTISSMQVLLTFHNHLSFFLMHSKSLTTSIDSDQAAP